MCFSENSLFLLFSIVDEDAREKLGPFSSMTGDESYQSRCNFLAKSVI